MPTQIAIILTFAAASALAADLPVNDLAYWEQLTYSNIPPNEVNVKDGSLRITIRSSASPLIYRLERPTRITGISVVARWSGALKIPDGARQGDRGADDFVLKFGIVEAGDQTLNWLQKRFAADWIRHLYRLAPKGTGLRRINFLSTTQQPELLGTERRHPLSDLMYETRIVLLEGPGTFAMTHRFEMPVEVLGLWISSDGDDTGSDFDLEIDSITLHSDERSGDSSP